MSNLRSYADPCGIARALDVIGERWALLIVRELLFGPKRFTDLRGGLPDASPNVLSQRLRELEGGGVVQRSAGGAAAYELTEWGRGLHPILLALGVWGARSPHRPAGALGPDALMVALEATFQPAKAKGAPACVAVELGEARFTAQLGDGALSITRGAPPAPDAVLATDAATLRAVAFGDQPLEDAPIAISGDPRAARRLLRAFARPTRTPVPARSRRAPRERDS
jgi:DNA-binding HxlR family transcriptional regulator